MIDNDKCILGGECIYNQPDYFAWGDDDTVAVVVKPEIVTDEDQLHAQQAMDLCPGRAITIEPGEQ